MHILYDIDSMHVYNWSYLSNVVSTLTFQIPGLFLDLFSKHSGIRIYQSHFAHKRDRTACLVQNRPSCSDEGVQKFAAESLDHARPSVR